jgi:hypothetical protein
MGNTQVSAGACLFLSVSAFVCVCVCVCEGMGRPAQIRYLGSHMWLMDDMRGIFRARKCSRHREKRFEDGSDDDGWTQNSTEANGMSICMWLRLRLRMWLEPTTFFTPPSSLSLSFCCSFRDIIKCDSEGTRSAERGQLKTRRPRTRMAHRDARRARERERERSWRSFSHTASPRPRHPRLFQPRTRRDRMG